MDVIAVLDADKYYHTLDKIDELHTLYRDWGNNAIDSTVGYTYLRLAEILLDVNRLLADAEIQPDGL